MLRLFAPIPLIDRHRHPGEPCYIVPGKRHIVLIEHRERSLYIFPGEAVDLLDAHFIIGQKERIGVLAQLGLLNTALLSVDRQGHYPMIAVAHPDLVPDAAQPPIIEISFHRPATPPLPLHYPPLIPIWILLLCFSQGHRGLSQNPLQLLPLPVRCWYVVQKTVQLHPITEPVGRHRITLAQL